MFSNALQRHWPGGRQGLEHLVGLGLKGEQYESARLDSIYLQQNKKNKMRKPKLPKEQKLGEGHIFTAKPSLPSLHCECPFLRGLIGTQARRYPLICKTEWTCL